MAENEYKVPNLVLLSDAAPSLDNNFTKNYKGRVIYITDISGGTTLKLKLQNGTATFQGLAVGDKIECLFSQILTGTTISKATVLG